MSRDNRKLDLQAAIRNDHKEFNIWISNFITAINYSNANTFMMR